MLREPKTRPPPKRPTTTQSSSVVNPTRYATHLSIRGPRYVVVSFFFIVYFFINVTNIFLLIAAVQRTRRRSPRHHHTTTTTTAKIGYHSPLTITTTNTNTFAFDINQHPSHLDALKCNSSSSRGSRRVASRALVCFFF